MFAQGSKVAVLESKLDMYEDLSREMLAKLEQAVEKISEENNTIIKEFVSGLDTREYIHDIYEPENNVDDSDEEKDEDETIKKYVIREDIDAVGCKVLSEEY